MIVKKHLLLNLVAITTLCMSSVSQAKPLSQPQISVQLWSIKDDVKKDIDSALATIAQLGFDGVEFANEFGPYKDDPMALKHRLDELGLQAPAAHVDLSDLDEANFERTVLFYKTLGVRYLIDPWQDEAWDPNKIDSVVARLNALAEKLKPYGMQIGYHNHDKEFGPFKHSTYWEYLADNTSDNVLLQHDIGWIQDAGKNPLDYITKYNERTILAHYKIVLPEPNPQGYSPILGDDNYIDWKGITRINLSSSIPKWLVIEQETYPEGLTPMESVAKSKLGLDKILSGL